MKKPYLKKLCEIGNIKCWIVDGTYVRNHIEKEFTNFGHHYRFKVIPENEFWLDKESADGEERYYLCNVKTIEAIKKGKSYKEAVEIGEKAEKRERAKSELSKKAGKKQKHGEGILRDIYKNQIKIPNSDMKVIVVNGEFVRDQFFLDFTEGGHDRVYHFIPKGEIWIDDDVQKKEIKFVLLHEIHERNLMAKGWTYDRAHIDSSCIEGFCRHHPNKVDKMLKVEFQKAKVN